MFFIRKFLTFVRLIVLFEICSGFLWLIRVCMRQNVMPNFPDRPVLPAAGCGYISRRFLPGRCADPAVGLYLW